MSESIHIDANPRLIRDRETPVTIVIDFDRPTRVRGIHATFHAAERTEATYTVTTTDAKGRARTETRTAVEFCDIVKQPFLLFGSSRKGFFSRLLDSLLTWFGGGQHEIMEPGRKEFALSLKIPSQAPASFQGEKCEVFYRLHVQVDLPVKIDWSRTHSFSVGPKIPQHEVNPVHVVLPDEAGRSFWDRTLGKEVTLNLALDRDTLSAGESALAMLTVETPQPLKLDEISVELAGTESTRADGHTDSYIHRHPLDNIDSPNILSGDSVHEFNIRIPEIEGPHTGSGANFSISWCIEVRLRVPWAKDPVIRVPIHLVPGN